MTLEANIDFSSQYDRSHLDGACLITDNGGSGSRLSFASSAPTVLGLDARKGELRGALRYLGGRHHASASSVHYSTCTRTGVIGDGCMSGPAQVQGAELDVLVRKGRPVLFWRTRFPTGA